MNHTVQDHLFQQVKEILPADISVAEAVSEILNVSTDSAYRRIRGETPLVLDEVLKICHHFNLSLDRLLEKRSNTVVFRNTRIHNQHFTYPQYLDGLKKQIQSLERFQQKEVIYMSKDLPLFYNFYFKPLIAFRYFFWMKIQLRHPDFEHRPFEMDTLPGVIEQLSHDLVKSYSAIPSTEIWNMESINSTISQIEFSRTSGHFKDGADAMKVYDALEATINHIKEQAENGCKYMPGEDPYLQVPNFKFFFNRVVLGDNTIMTITDNLKSAFINYGNLNYLMTTDEAFCSALYDDFENLKRLSTLISTTSERQRNIFFNILLSKINERKRHLV